MRDKGKKIFLALSIFVPFMIYCVYYYGTMIKNAPYKFSEFQSFNLKYGIGDSLVNSYDSKTGIYQYVNTRDSLVRKNVKLNKDDLLFLHRKAVELGLWDFPTSMRSSEGEAKSQVHYHLEYIYQRKTKVMDFDAGYTGSEKLKDAVRALVETINNTVNRAEARTQ